MLWTELEDRMERLFDPWQEFERMRRSFFTPAPSRGDFPAVNVWVGADHAVLTTELPGLAHDAIEISVSGNTLTLKGSREPEKMGEDESYHRRERWYGQFSKTINLPFNVEADKVHATFSKGVLSIDLPRAESEKPRKIEIKAQ